MTLSDHGWNAIMTMAMIATHDSEQALRLKDIRNEIQVSRPYMERILAKLRNAGLVEGVRGTGGGYYLNRPINSITLAEIINAAEESDAYSRWMEGPSKSKEQKIVQQAWHQIDGRLYKLLSGITLGGLLKIEDKRPSYQPGITARLIARMFPARRGRASGEAMAF